jgi:hypothetical protein
LQFVSHFDRFIVIFNPLFLVSEIFDNQLRFLWIIPKIRGKSFFFFVRNLN